MAILASGHKLVRCGIDGAISGVVTDETLSGNGTSGKPLGALLEDVLFDDSITESSTDFGTLIGVNPLWVNYVVTGGGSSGGDPQVNYIVKTYSGAWNDTTDVVQSNSSNWNNVTNKLDTTSFSTVSGNFLTAVDLTPYQPKSGMIEYYTTADANTLSSLFSGAIDYVSANAGIDFPASADNAVQYVQSTSGVINETTNVVQSNSAQWAEGGTGDVEVNSFVYNNSATINEVNTAYQTHSASYQPTGNYIPYTGYSASLGYVTNSSFTIHNGSFTNTLGRGTIVIQNRISSNIYNNMVAGPASISFSTLSDSAKVDLPSINKWNDVSTTVQSNSAQWAEGGSGDVEVNSFVYDNSATINEVNTTFQNNSGNYLTAHQDISNKLDITAFTSWTATQEANDYELSAGIGVTLYDDTVNKITRIDVTAGTGDIEVNSFVYNNSATINEVNTTFQNNSGNYLTAHQSLAGYATQDWVTAQGYITGVDLSNYYTKNDTSSKSEINAALTSITPGNVGVNSYVQSNSATINNVNTTYQSNSGHYLTAHQDISNKLDTNSFTAWSAAQAANAFKLSAGNGINLIDDSINKITRIDVTAGAGDIEVNTYVRNNSAGINNAVSTYQSNSANYLTAVSIPQSSTWNDVASTYQTASSTYLTAHQDISNKLDITAFDDWSARNAFKLSAGNGVTLYDDTVNKITRIDANGSNFLTIYSKNEQQNTNVLGYYFLADNVNEIEGIVQFVPNGNGTFALCPFTAENNNAYYSSLSYQCTNSPTVNSGDLVTLPFHFFADGQYVCPSVLGIKGSNSTATITPYNIIINYK